MIDQAVMAHLGPDFHNLLEFFQPRGCQVNLFIEIYSTFISIPDARAKDALLGPVRAIREAIVAHRELDFHGLFSNLQT